MITLDPSRSARAIGLALGAAASLAELGPIVALLREHHGLIAVLCAGLFYQVGGAAARLLPGVTRAGPGIVATSGIVLVTANPGHPVWFIAIAAMSWALQCTRRHHGRAFTEGAPSTAQKRAARVLGFIAAGLAPFSLSVAIIIGFVVIATWFCRSEPGRLTVPRLSGHPIEAVMVLHQIHYFTYCYAIILVLAQTAGGPSLVGIWFGLGWITYLSAERLWSSVPVSTALVVGHLFVAATLVALTIFDDVGWKTVLLWSLTGLGGGTVYCLARIHRAAELPSEALDLAEDIGHVGGAALALLVAVALNADAWGLAVLGAVFALATPAAFLISRAWVDAAPLSGSRGA